MDQLVLIVVLNTYEVYIQVVVDVDNAVHEADKADNEMVVVVADPSYVKVVYQLEVEVVPFQSPLAYQKVVAEENQAGGMVEEEVE